MKQLIKGIFQKFGYQISSYPESDIKRRIKILNNSKISKLMDVGANYGHYALELRKFGFNGNIISFEPLTSAFKLLKANSLNDKKWEQFNFALGNNDGDAIINIAGNSFSSSLSKMLDSHIKAAPYSAYIGTENISIKKIDTIFDSVYNEGDNIMLKIDTQGYERNVLEGADQSLKYIRLIQLEMSLIPLYENEMQFQDMMQFLRERNFELISIENGFSNQETGQLLQIDGIFINKYVKPVK